MREDMTDFTVMTWVQFLERLVLKTAALWTVTPPSIIQGWSQNHRGVFVSEFSRYWYAGWAKHTVLFKSVRLLLLLT